MHELIDSLINFFGTIDYTAIFILMAMESSIIPVPSELVMIPAGMNTALNPYIASLVGGLGSVLGALVNYWIIGRWLGKPFLKKYGKYILITPEKYQRSEDLFLKNANLYTFIGRFIPVIRHLISIPAGIFQMKMLPFITLTFIGATLWSGCLVWLGRAFGDSVIETIKMYSHEFTIIGVPLIALFFLYKIFKK